MVTPQKIDEWLKEAEARPQSAALVLKLLANRLRELSARDEELLAENIALQSGERVEEYQKRIAHLEYQLELLKRRYGESTLAEEPAPSSLAAVHLLAYNARGRFLCLNPGDATDLGRLNGDLSPSGEPPRLLASRADEELLFLHTSGRISARPLEDIPVTNGGAWTWDALSLPDEPHAGELLACVMPLANLPLADFFLQTSRRGYLKKTLASMAQGILANHYLGKGTVQKADQPFDVTLCREGERLVLASREGRLLCIALDDLSYAPEECIRLEATDHIVAAFILHPGESLFVLTNTGKVIHRLDDLEPAKSSHARGQALLSPTRLESGIRLIGAAAVSDPDRVLVLGADGGLSIHGVADLSGAGAVPVEGGLLAFAPVSASGGGK